MDYRKQNTLLIIVAFFCVCKIKGSERYVECNNITRIQIYEQFQSVAFLEYTSLRGCKKQYCNLRPYEEFSHLYIEGLRFSPHDDVLSYVRHWQDKELQLEFDADSIIIQPNKTSKLQYELPRKLTASGRGNFYLTCTTEGPEGVPFPREVTTKHQFTDKKTSDDKSFPAYIIVIIVIIILLLIMSAAIAAFFTSRKMKKFLRRKKNLTSHSAYGCPEFGSDNNNDYANNDDSGSNINGVDMKLGTGYKSLDVLNDADEDHLESTNRSQPLTLNINAVDRSDDSEAEAKADPHLYANLSSPVNSLKPKPLSHLTREQNSQNSEDPYDRVASPTNSEVPSALYYDPEQDWSTRAPLLTPTREHASDSDSEHEYDYTYMSAHPLNSTPKNMPSGKPNGAFTDQKDQYSEVNKPAQNQKVSDQIRLLDSKVPISVPNQKPSGSPALLPKPKTNIYDNIEESTDNDKPAPKQNKLLANTDNTKGKKESPKLLPKPKPGNVHLDNGNKANPLHEILKVQLRPTKSSAEDKSGPLSKPGQSPKVQLKQTKSTPNQLQPSPAQPTNKFNPKPLGTPAPPKQAETDSNVNQFVKLKPVNERMKNTADVSNSKSSPTRPTPAKKALMPPKTPFKPKNIIK